jgi:two-component system CheB/CheR fusion protein
VKIFCDETASLEAKEALEKSHRELSVALHDAEQARAEAEAAARAKDHFLAVLSHELRTPLTPVLMAVDGLSHRKDLAAPVRKALDMIRRNVQIESHFIDDLLDLTRIRHGKLEFARAQMDLHEAVRHAMQIVGPDLKNKHQRLSVSLDAPSHTVYGDSTRLKQVFWNLLKNASKFTPEGGAISIRSRNNERGDRIAIEITDSGVGFEPEAAERIFDAFVQANEAVAREFGGLGLGLAISKATVDAHNGTMRASSAGRDQGSTFTVELPIFTQPAA